MPHIVSSLIILLAVGATLTPFLADAAIKQLTVHERLKYARHVFVGTVESVEFKDIDRAPQFPEWITRHYKCVVRVDRVVKSNKHSRPNPSHPADELVEGPLVHLMAWKGIGRPAGFVGDSGTATIPEVGKTYAFYTQFLHPDPQLRSTYHESYPHVEEEEFKAYNALMPNGIGELAELLDHEAEDAHAEL
ncbi:membrane-associated protein, putative [Bodo saltans]|uniref:Membrane-associated protein, putative n=1 Tax=Bodo saltans TaxID=75058 RepID=A0A0S4J2H0_BODSA|nr:membrane-associated protein, putative [Bodo saltans]|eukprot:CUG06173.1 membrane-associated protein, putative [Bodo saltans]